MWYDMIWYDCVTTLSKFSTYHKPFTLFIYFFSCLLLPSHPFSLLLSSPCFPSFSLLYLKLNRCQWMVTSNRPQEEFLGSLLSWSNTPVTSLQIFQRHYSEMSPLTKWWALWRLYPLQSWRPLLSVMWEPHTHVFFCRIIPQLRQSWEASLHLLPHITLPRQVCKHTTHSTAILFIAMSWIAPKPPLVVTLISIHPVLKTTHTSWLRHCTPLMLPSFVQFFPR